MQGFVVFDYADKYAMKAAVYAMYVKWNAEYLE